MRNVSYLFFFLILAISAVSCENTKRIPDNNATVCYQGILKVKGICGQRVISVLNQDMDKLQVEASWTDPITNEIITNAFSVDNVCDFPENINVGDTISFQTIKEANRECAVCLAYIPVPESKNIIRAGCPK